MRQILFRGARSSLWDAGSLFVGAGWLEAASHLREVVVSRYGASQVFLERMVVLSWGFIAFGLLVLVLGIFDLEWIAVVVGAGIIAAGVGYRWLANWLAEWASRRDFEDRWRR
ncbi:hypothetical protein [Actinomadura sp. HBU206391]|uniref:hypothetical protein n=1 Tax=Actinomadura sp. HBU206391 TaxID=2731692 RepID=UPI00164FE050|nr:hypothetical protein [Actinomadura sp. HBU206391]MBC6463773.1 hypothetical protein [Actinomadura sp. HBU206391]